MAYNKGYNNEILTSYKAACDLVLQPNIICSGLSSQDLINGNEILHALIFTTGFWADFGINLWETPKSWHIKFSYMYKKN